MTFEKDIHTFYDGKPQPAWGAQSWATFDSVDPATGTPLAKIYTTSESQLDEAVESAAKAFPAWSATAPVERARILLRAAALLRERNDAIAKTETLDTGKAWSETSTVDVVTGADVLEYYAHFVASGGLDGKTTILRPGPSGASIHTSYDAVGVCAGIGAWNYPIQIALWKSAACLAAGNCMVYKPSEVTPLHGNTLAAIYVEAGLPKGVFNVVYGAGDVGAALVAHPKIAKVSFTGQVATGAKVASAAVKDMKSVTMELGGKSPLVILPDADVDEAADIAMMANFYSSGQVCTNGTRVFVPDTLLDKVEAAIVQRCRDGIRMGMPMDEKTNFGPLVSKAQQDKVNGYIATGRKEARVLYDGAREAQATPPNPGGFWVPPVVFSDCTDDMTIVRDEIFGPVMAILPYSTAGSRDEWLEKLIARANDTAMGLAAGVCARDIGLAQYVIRRLEAGITWINTWGESPAEMPVGGWKMSGLGVENGHEGIMAYTRTKSTLVQLGTGACASVFSKL
ncbi:aldehyde dehydrogenase [Cutaneotrichosporon oleaginosum]|uniref:Aldehyde dehydrogenase n=1 Tax=Cutaneotrichosporon oleaginosum TaxID=879819 RepID=A0A0J0XSB0_9TREE|nr:aldehyde dehydrogenase [Cutaneotrichosporon oleaginosum]KLT43942.1 aldehyde dehydrogenase [Cutaneotrichosporon oleaginosum]